MDFSRNSLLIMYLVQGRACMRIEPLGGIAKKSGNRLSGGPSLILERLDKVTLKFCVEPSAVWK